MRIPIAIIAFLLTGSIIQAQPRNLILRGIQFDAGADPFAITELSDSAYVDIVGGDIRSQLSRVQQYVERQEFLEAEDLLNRLSEQNTNKLVPDSTSNRGFQRYLTLPWLIKQRLGEIIRLSPEAMQRYRNRVDPLAAEWYREGIARHDKSYLERCVARLGHSSSADESLLSLGELALESGEFAKARKCFGLIYSGLQWASKPSGQPVWLRIQHGEPAEAVAASLQADDGDTIACADSDIDLTDIWARMVLISILQQRRDRAEAELRLFREVWPAATGYIAGRQTNYLEFLDSLFRASLAWPERIPSMAWPTFAGSAERNTQPPIVLDLPVEPAWRVALKPSRATGKLALRTHGLPAEKSGELVGRPCSHHPIVINDLVLVQDEESIRCLRLATGHPAWGTAASGEIFRIPSSPDSRDFVPFDPNLTGVDVTERRFTLSAASGTVVARVNSPNATSRSGDEAMIGFSLEHEGGIQFGPLSTDDPRWSLLGTPLAEGDRCWVGMRLREGTAQDYVACFDMRSGQELWRTRICSADTIADGTARESPHHLVTKHEDTVYFVSHLGAVAAISADQGSIQWLTTYPRMGPKRDNLLDEPWYAQRDLTPCVYHDGLLIVAPADSDRIFALHADTGILIWESELAKDANQILGVGDGKHLILSGRRLWWLDVWTGKLSDGIPVNPFPSGNLSSPNGNGRGVLTGGNVYWPTHDDDGDKIFVFRQTTGRMQQQPIDLRTRRTEAGNMIVTPTHLLIATPDELVAFALPHPTKDPDSNDEAWQSPSPQRHP